MIDILGDDSDQEARISKLEVTLNANFSKQYKGGLTQWVQYYQNAFAVLEILVVKAYADEESKKRKMVQNCVAPGSRDVMYMSEICKDKSFKDTCEMIRKQAIASDSRGSRGVNSTMVQLFADLVAAKVNVN